MSTETASLDSLISEIGLTMTAKHVPSQYDPKAPREEFQGIKWECTLTTPRGSFSVPFTQGIGHLPELVYDRRHSLFNWQLDKINRALKTGCINGLGSRKLSPPSLSDVLGCLCSDAEAINETFEDCAANFGYDSDSRKAEKIFNDCRETGFNLLRVIGSDRFEELRNAINEAGF